jgi:hypothetical protein
MTRNEANVLIDYIETLGDQTNHQQIMAFLSSEFDLTEEELDGACRALAEIAGRDFGIL